VASALGNYYDRGFINGFVGIDTARPFYGSRSADPTKVGIYAGDACLLFGVACSTSATQLISWNALNTNSTGALLTCPTCISPITNNDVRFIINARTSQAIFGTPFGNVPRNALSDAISNRLDASIFKNLKLGEKSNFEMRLSATNALNHFNFGSVDPNLEDGGIHVFGAGFADPSITGANGRVVSISGRITF
jgi:hypothetical protein